MAQGWIGETKKHSIASKKGWIKRKKIEKSKYWTPEREEYSLRSKIGIPFRFR